MNVYFCGMIGSGKTTVGIRLARRLELDFLDLDREMDRILGYSFHRLVSEKGWLAFRELEYSICKSFAARDRTVICLGGGTVRYEWNRDILRGTGFTILLTASLEELARRVRLADRPRVNRGTSLEEDLGIMWETARDKYYMAADAVFDTEEMNIDDTLDELERVVREKLGLRNVGK